MNMNNDYFTDYLKTLDLEGLVAVLERATGQTTRICDDIIQKIFNTPCGEWIEIHDHYGTKEADEMLLKKVMGRIENEYPNLSIEVGRTRTPLRIRRKNKTFHELVLEEFDKRVKQTKEL